MMHTYSGVRKRWPLLDFGRLEVLHTVGGPEGGAEDSWAGDRVGSLRDMTGGCRWSVTSCRGADLDGTAAC